jgi:hypothetical protein
MTKAGLATEVFGGRLSKQLLPALGELKQKMDEVPKSALISDENVKKAHDFDVGMQHLETQLKATTVALLGWMAAAAKSAAAPGMEESLTISASADERARNAAGAHDIALPKEETARVISNAQAIANELNALREKALTPLSAAQKQQINDLKEWGKGEDEIAQKIKAPVEAIHRYEEAQKTSKRASEEFLKAQNDLLPVLTNRAWDGSIDSMLKLGGSVHETAVYFGTSEGEVRRHAEAMKTWDKVVGIEATKSASELTGELQKLGTAVPQKFFDDGGKAVAALEKIENGARFTAKELAGMGEAAKPSLHDLNATFGTINLNFETLEKVSTSGLKHTAEVARETYDFMRQHSEMFSSETIQHFHDIAIAADAAAGSISAKFTLAFKSTVGDLNRVFQSAFEGGGGIGGAVSSLATNLTSNLLSAIPVVGPMLGQFAGALVSGVKAMFGGPSKDELAARDTFGQFQKQFGTLQQTIDAVGAAYAKAGKTGTEAQAALKRALDATHVSAEAEKKALDEINGVLNEQKQDDADLQTAIGKYKFSIEELGPAMQKQQLDQQAQQLMNDWRLLVGSGIELTTVNEHMASSVQDYLNKAKATGQEVPIAMQPILQKMIDQGLLTDDAGKKITDMKDLGVTFAETMTEGFNKVVDKLTELINKISATTGAINAIPNSKTISIETVYSTVGAPSSDQVQDVSGASAGGYVTDYGIQHFGGGGVVLPFRPMGTDTVPAMLTPGEMVLTKRQQRAVFGSGSAPTIDMSEFKAMRNELQSLRAEQSAAARRLPTQLGAAVTSALLTAREGRK